MTQATPGPRPPHPPQASPVKFKAALRKAIRKNAKEPEIDYLNITAMLDMMTIILVFLLKNMSSSNAAPPQSDDLKLPPSIMSTQPKEEGVAIFVTRSQILVGDNPDPVVLLPDRAQLASTGLDARYKRDGINSLYITPLGNALQVVREQDKAIRTAKGEPPDSKSEAIIIADQNTPYRLLIEVLYTLGQSEFGKFRLMVMSGSAAKQQLAPPGTFGAAGFPSLLPFGGPGSATASGRFR
ncbi:MAG: biopolymer transporter ExbD [Polyangiaceae bacterium]|jgi:biopolymer transport protein ExbD|nr:biopolymer transporter ExbD [Polyangiaceae bacterium]